jgi:ATP-dependent Clp protease ATP-binding subunit ClpB
MDMSKLTQKSQEALQQAQSEAVRRHHTETDGEHLLLALLDQPEGIIPTVGAGRRGRRGFAPPSRLS